MIRELPEVIKEVGFPFSWREDEVWAIDAQIEKIALDELDWHMDIPFWDTGDGFYDLTPREVVNNPDKYSYHQDRIENSDLSYALDILNNPKTGRWTLLDGLHRFVKLVEMGEVNVKVRKISIYDIQKTKSYKSR